MLLQAVAVALLAALLAACTGPSTADPVATALALGTALDLGTGPQGSAPDVDEVTSKAKGPYAVVTGRLEHDPVAARDLIVDTLGQNDWTVTEEAAVDFLGTRLLAEGHGLVAAVYFGAGGDGTFPETNGVTWVQVAVARPNDGPAWADK